MYEAFKHSHVLFVAISVALFLLRFIWKQMGAGILQQRWVKIVPHVNDTLLLASAIAMLIMTHRAPISDPWVTEKVLGVIGYIAFGVVAFKSTSKAKSWLGFIVAVGFLAALLHVAVSKQTLLLG